MKKIGITLVGILAVLFGHAFHAQANEFQVHLYYQANSNELRFDKFSQQAVTLNTQSDRLPSLFLYDNEGVHGKYVVSIFDVQGANLISLEFNPTPGAFVLDLPYFGVAQNIIIYDKITNSELLRQDVSQFVTCNLNGVCEYEKGETMNQCLGDCGANAHAYSEETLQKLREQNGVIRDPQTNEILVEDEAHKNAGRQTTPTVVPSAPDVQPTDGAPGAQTQQGSKAMAILLITFSVGVIGAALFLLYKKVLKK